MATLTATAVSLSGISTTTAASSSNGDTFANTGHEMLLVKNDTGSSITVSAVLANRCNQGTLHTGLALAVASSSQHLTAIGPFPVSQYGNSVTVTYSAAGAGVKLISLSPAS